MGAMDDAAHAAGDAHGGGHGAAHAAVQLIDSQGPGWLLLIPILPLVGVVIVGLLAATRNKTKLPAFVTVGCLAASFVVTLLAFLQHDASVVTTARGFEWIRLVTAARGGGVDGSRVCGSSKAASGPGSLGPENFLVSCRSLIMSRAAQV